MSLPGVFCSIYCLSLYCIGKESFSIQLPAELKPGQLLTVKVCVYIHACTCILDLLHIHVYSRCTCTVYIARGYGVEVTCTVVTWQYYCSDIIWHVFALLWYNEMPVFRNVHVHVYSCTCMTRGERRYIYGAHSHVAALHMFALLWYNEMPVDCLHV